MKEEEKKEALILNGIDVSGKTDYGICLLYDRYIQPVVDSELLKAHIIMSELLYSDKDQTKSGTILYYEMYKHPKGWMFKVLTETTRVVFHKGQVIGVSSDQMRSEYADDSAELVSEKRFSILEINGRRSSMDDFRSKL